eukprot:458040-Pyramimonas_sp.AAC.1
MPFILAGDFNVEPDVLGHSGWVAAIDAAVVAPSDGTCRPADRDIDYFIARRELAPCSSAR